MNDVVERRPGIPRTADTFCSDMWCLRPSSRALGSVTELNCAAPESVTSVDFIEPVTLSKPVIDVPESITDAWIAASTPLADEPESVTDAEAEVRNAAWMVEVGLVKPDRLAAIMANPILADPRWHNPIRPGGLADDDWASTLEDEARCRLAHASLRTAKGALAGKLVARAA